MPRVAMDTVSGVARIIAIMETLAGHEGLTTSNVARLLSLPKSSTSYILRDLERLGYLSRSENGGYKLSSKVAQLGRSVAAVSEVRKLALPIMSRIVERTGLVACLAIPDGGETVVILKAGDPSFRIDDYVSARMDIHATAAGKALLAQLPVRERNVVVSRAGLRRWTPNTITALPRLTDEVEVVRTRGYATDLEESASGIRCVAAPIFGPFRKATASLAVAGRSGQLDDSYLARVGTLVREAASMISDQLESIASE